MNRLRHIWELKTAPKKRGVEPKAAQREMERQVRKRVVAFSRWARGYGLGVSRAAARLGISARTLAGWQSNWRLTHLPVEPLGRPPQTAEPSDRELVLALFDLMGASVGVPTMQALVPWVSRRELEELARRYKAEHLWRSKRVLKVLTWSRPGTVWAMDYANPPASIDGVYEKILAVRDLASGNLLASMPAEAESAEGVSELLEALIVEHGAPLVVKSDNGGPFTADDTREYLESREILPLYSPPAFPQYNGACEAGIGALKVRAHHLAAREGRAGHWTSNDVEGARLMANETLRAPSPSSPTPDERWNQRTPVRPAERASFRAAVERYRLLARGEQGVLPGVETSAHTEATIERIAISRALVAHDLLEYRRRSITLPITPQFRANIS